MPVETISDIFIYRTKDEINNDFYPRITLYGCNYICNYHGFNRFWFIYGSALEDASELEPKETMLEIAELMNSTRFEEPLTYLRFYNFALLDMINVVNP